jgi:thiol-disulfide isomerase/thioredoxin
MLKLTLFLNIIFVFYNCSNAHKENSDVPDICGKLLFADSTNVKTIAKNNITVVNVWGIFCLPCMQELPILQSVYDKYSTNENIRFISVTMDSENEFIKFLNPADTNNYYRKMFMLSKLDTFYLPTMTCLPHGYTSLLHDYAFGIVQDSNECRSIQKKIGSFAVPTTLIYNEKGQLAFKQIGSFDNDSLLLQKIDSLLLASKGKFSN